MGRGPGRPCFPPGACPRGGSHTSLGGRALLGSCAERGGEGRRDEALKALISLGSPVTVPGILETLARFSGWPYSPALTATHGLLLDLASGVHAPPDQGARRVSNPRGEDPLALDPGLLIRRAAHPVRARLDQKDLPRGERRCALLSIQAALPVANCAQGGGKSTPRPGGGTRGSRQLLNGPLLGLHLPAGTAQPAPAERAKRQAP